MHLHGLRVRPRQHRRPLAVSRTDGAEQIGVFDSADRPAGGGVPFSPSTGASDSSGPRRASSWNQISTGVPAGRSAYAPGACRRSFFKRLDAAYPAWLRAGADGQSPVRQAVWISRARNSSITRSGVSTAQSSSFIWTSLRFSPLRLVRPSGVRTGNPVPQGTDPSASPRLMIVDRRKRQQTAAAGHPCNGWRVYEGGGHQSRTKRTLAGMAILLCQP